MSCRNYKNLHLSLPLMVFLGLWYFLYQHLPSPCLCHERKTPEFPFPFLMSEVFPLFLMLQNLWLVWDGPIWDSPTTCFSDHSLGRTKPFNLSTWQKGTRIPSHLYFSFLQEKKSTLFLSSMSPRLREIRLR